MLATNERFLLARGTFGAILASESHWLQLVLILYVRWWPTMAGVGRILLVQAINEQALPTMVTSSGSPLSFAGRPPTPISVGMLLVNDNRCNIINLQWPMLLYLEGRANNVVRFTI